MPIAYNAKQKINKYINPTLLIDIPLLELQHFEYSDFEYPVIINIVEK